MSAGQCSKRGDDTNVGGSSFPEDPTSLGMTRGPRRQQCVYQTEDTRPSLSSRSWLRLGSCAEELGHHSIGEPLLDNSSAVYRERASCIGVTQSDCTTSSRTDFPRL